jgi:magnesium-transporting ATPase (P-type)
LVDVFVTAVTILVVAIPEGLPLAVTLALSYSAKKMVKDNLTVKKIDSAETMGSATTICTDKTGTLTKNIMISVSFVGGGQPVNVLRPETPNTATPEARKKIMKDVLSQGGYQEEFMHELATSIAINSSDDAIVTDQIKASGGSQNYTYVGNPTDCAMLALTYELGYDYNSIRADPDFQEGDKSLKIGRNQAQVVPFQSEIKCMFWAVPHGDGIRVYVKGAGEKVLAACTHYLAQDGKEEKVLDDNSRAELDQLVVGFQNQAYRVISTGYRDFPNKDALKDFDLASGLTELYKDIVLIGVVGIQDPLKESVKEAIANCFKAGVDVRMITGDNKRTAVAIAINCGILREEHFNHVINNHPCFTDHKFERFLTMLKNHKTMDEISFAMRKSKHTEEDIATFIAGCEKCRGVMVDRQGGKEFEPDPLEALRENFALEGQEFAKKVHSEEFQLEHYPFAGEASNEAYGHTVYSVDENGEPVHGWKATKNDNSKLPLGVNQEALDEIWPKLRVMARCHPMDKQTLVSGLMESEICFNREARQNLKTNENIWIFGDHQIVAVTGDGTNDAPALRKANIGFAMGIAGTDVAKEACDIIVMDDNFSSVVTSLMWGRNVYDSVAKFLQFQLTVNVVAVVVASLGAVIYQSSPLGAVQMLWVNLVMDSLGSLALATEKPHMSLLERKPYGRKMSMISRPMRFNIFGQAIYQLTITLLIMFYGEVFLYSSSDRDLNQQNAIDASKDELVSGRAAGCDATQHYSILFNTFVMMTLFNQISARKLNNEFNLFAGITENNMFLIIMGIEFVAQFCFVQFLGNFAECYDEGLTWRQWIWCIGLGVGVWPTQLIINFVVKSTADDPETAADKQEQEDIRTSYIEDQAPKPTSIVDTMADALSNSRLGAHHKLMESMNGYSKKAKRREESIIQQSIRESKAAAQQH